MNKIGQQGILVIGQENDMVVVSKYDPKATPDPDCKACMQKWPIHVNQQTGERTHVDVIGFHKDYGFITPCPTQNWPDEEEETENADTL